MTDRVPYIRELHREECVEILERNRVGRIAYSHGDRVNIEPLHYVLDEEWLLVRTSKGSKVASLPHNPWVAFEVDEVEEMFRWRSVVVHGVVQTMSAEVNGQEQFDKAVEALRRLIPGALTEDDPVAFRDVVLRVHLSEISGREAEPIG
jgi:uncharacterized protein